MLDFLGVTEHFSCVENTPFSFPALFRDMAGEAVSLDGVIFSGSIVCANHEVVKISIEKGEASNEVILSFPALPEGRWPYNVLVQGDDGSQRILFSGYISAVGISRAEQLAGDAPMKNRTLLVAMPGEASTRLRMEWMATTAAQAFAAHALQSSRAAHTDADTAGKAATTATGAASAATERAREAEGYASAAYSSQVAAGNSATAASTSAADAARDARSVHDAKTAVDGIASSFSQTVSNGEQTIIAARDEAVAAIQTKQADSVLAVGRAQKTATDKVAGVQGTAVTAVETARTEAVGAVQTAKTEAVETITPLVQRAETAKEAIDQAEGRIHTAETNAGASATNAASSATAAADALAAIPQVDASGNMTLNGGLTAAGTINANGGINIPLAAGLPTDTSASSRAYSAGMAHLISLHTTRLYWWTDKCTASGGVTINHIAPGSYCQVNLSANKRSTLRLPSDGALGAGNYGKTMGYIVPMVNRAGGVNSWSKLTILIGEAQDTWEEVIDGGVDDFRWRPVSGDTIFLRCAIEVTIYGGNSNDGYKVRVRELTPIGNPKRYVVRTSVSMLPYNNNTNPQQAIYKIVISQGSYAANDSLTAGVWAIMGGHSNDTVIKLADIRGWEGYHLIYPPDFFYDALCGQWGGQLCLESPSVINGVGLETYMLHALEPYQVNHITSITEEPYIYPEQSAE